MKILVTGATGYLGHRLALALAERNNEVHILVRNINSRNIPQHTNIRIFAGDITDRQSITLSIMGCKQVFHTAALVKIFDKDTSLFYKVNVEGTRNMLEIALEKGIEKFVFTSSCSVIGPTIKTEMCENDSRTTPLDNDYEITKFLAENLVKEYSCKGLHTVIVSPSKVFGPSGFETQTISMNKVINQFIKGKLTFIPRPGKLVANYCFIDDVIDGHILAMFKGINGEKYILGGENISFVIFFHTIRTLSGTNARLVEVPKIFVKVLAIWQWIQFKTIHKEPLITGKSIQQFFCNKIFCSQKATQELGYRITPFEESLKQTIHFLKNQHHEK
jgi:nucleoside-diphosphate-sugar epimerase